MEERIKTATWYNIVYNGYEPDNRIRLVGELTDNDTYRVFQIWGYLHFNDGDFIVSIDRDENGVFHWRKSDEVGTASSFEEAWKKMPTYITDPDDYEELPMTYDN